MKASQKSVCPECRSGNAENDATIYTTAQAARICKVAPRTVCKWFDSRRLRGYRIPGSQDRRIPRKQLLAFLTEHGMEQEVDWEANFDGTLKESIEGGVTDGKLVLNYRCECSRCGFRFEHELDWEMTDGIKRRHSNHWDNSTTILPRREAGE